jgi:hypothetical protein
MDIPPIQHYAATATRVLRGPQPTTFPVLEKSRFSQGSPKEVGRKTPVKSMALRKEKRFLATEIVAKKRTHHGAPSPRPSTSPGLA